MIRNSKRALSDEQVHQARYDYYNENLTLKELAARYNTTLRVAQCAVNSLGSYANIPDQTPQHLKEQRHHPNTNHGQFIGRRAKLRERRNGNERN